MTSIHACRLANKGEISNTLSSMLNASDYWQPDKQSQWSAQQSSIGLAKAQLFNTKRSLCDGVYYDTDLGLAITANARIDNRNELVTALDLAYDDRRIYTDSQLILYTYAKWGRECVAFLRGDFVFVIWDENRQKLVCARDHFGVKILFYSVGSKGAMITNEHKAFFTTQWSDAGVIDEDHLFNTLWGLVPQPFDSPSSDIKVLPPAHILELDKNGVQVSQYWQLKAKSDWQHLSDEENIQELTNRFKRAVVARLDSEYPLGAELSEGLDSNGIVGFAANHLKSKTLHTFSYDCKAINDNNRHIWADTYADIDAMLAMHKNLQPVWQEDHSLGRHELNYQYRSEFYQHFGGVIPVYTEKFIRSRLAQSRGIRVMLSGWGGDHCVTSYGDNYCDELFRKREFIRLYQLLTAKYRRGRGSKPFKALLALLLKHCAPDFHLYIKRCVPGFNTVYKQRTHHHFLEKRWCDNKELNDAFHRHQKNHQRYSVQEKEQLELFELGLTTSLVEAELTARIARIEYRFPMLDVELVEFAHSLPSHLKMYQGIERYAFRRVLEGITTARIQWRRKADVSHPKRDKQHETNIRRKVLIERLRNSVLIQRFSSEAKLKKYLKHQDVSLFRYIEYLVHVEEYYYCTEQNSAQQNLKQQKIQAASEEKNHETV